jgi:large subunit ribosomal protein L4
VKQIVVDFNNKKISEISLNESVFGCEVKKDILAKVIQWQLDKRRSGNHKTKIISEISGTTKKPFKQKGTGNARQGSLRSPQFRGGAVIFGPVVRDHGYTIQKKVRKLAVRMALSQKMLENKLVIVKDYQLDSHKTKEFNSKIKNFSANSSLFLGVGNEEEHKAFRLASRNIPLISCLAAEGLNVYDIMKHDFLFIDEKTVKQLEERLA